VSFEQTVAKSETVNIALKQIAKANSALGVARVDLDNASFRLAKAEETMKATEVAYFEAVSKSAWNKDALQKAYNNALAGFREADKNFAVANKAFGLAQATVDSLNDLAKGKIPNRYGQMVEEDSSVPEGETTKEDDIVEVKPSQIMNQNGVMVPDFSLEKAGDPSTIEGLAELASDHEKKAGEARQAGDMKGHSAHASEAGRLRGKINQMQTEADNNRSVEKREFSNAKRMELAHAGKALPDGSFPIENKGDLQNAIQSVGRASSPAKAKSHIIRQAQALNAVDMLPEEWTKPSVSKAQKTEWKKPWEDDSSDEDSSADDSSKPTKKDASLLVLCPSCNGDNSDQCSNCGGLGTVSDDSSDDSSTPVAMGKAKNAKATKLAEGKNEGASEDDSSNDDSEEDSSGAPMSKSAFSVESLLYPNSLKN